MTRNEEAAFARSPVVMPVILVPYIAYGLPLIMIIAIGIFAVVLSYIGTFILGRPLYRLFRSNGWVSVWPMLLVSAVIGCLMWLTVLALFSAAMESQADRATHPMTSHPLFGWMALLGAGAGAAQGLVFWLTARPDRASANR